MKLFTKKTMLFIALIISTNLFADGTQPVGSGTQADPYLVASLDNLLWISMNSTSWDKYFTQTADIDATAPSGWNSGAGFSPIGNNTTAHFRGTDDSDNHTIDALTIDRSGSDYIGFIGYANTATIANINL